MPPAYTTAQKASISNLTSLTGIDKSGAAKLLKQNAWNENAAANAYVIPSSTRLMFYSDLSGISRCGEEVVFCCIRSDTWWLLDNKTRDERVGEEKVHLKRAYVAHAMVLASMARWTLPITLTVQGG